MIKFLTVTILFMCFSMSTGNVEEKCLKPLGTDCSFYTDCMAKGFPHCYDSSSDNNSTIAYSKSACEMYQKHFATYTSMGQLWIKAVRRCFQRNLATTITDNSTNVPCSELHDRAMSFRLKCFNESRIIESICLFPTTDVWKMFWTVKESFPSSYSNINHKIWQALESCSTKKTRAYQETTTNSVRHVVLTVRKVEKVANKQRFKREEPEKTNIETGGIIDELVDIAKFDKKQIQWFAYGGPDPSTNNIIIHIFFSDPTIIFDGNDKPSDKFEYAVRRFHRAVITGTKFIDKKTGSTYEVVKQLSFCANVFCR